MKIIEFSENWNGKLFLDNFGTVRLHNPDKYAIGNSLEVHLRKYEMGVAEIVAIRSFVFKNIGDVLAFLDTGKPAPYMAKLLRIMYQHKLVMSEHTYLDHIVLRYTKRNLAVHAQLLQDWWRTKCEQQPSHEYVQASFF